MFLDVPDPDETAGDLRERYADELADALEAAGRETVETETDLDPRVLDAIEARDGESLRDVEFEDAAAVLAVAEGRDADGVVAEARDDLMLAMSSAVLDVERLTREVDTDLDPKEVQAKMEGRLPMTLGEFAALRVAMVE